jgi:hypothetical protein
VAKYLGLKVIFMVDKLQPNRPVSISSSTTPQPTEKPAQRLFAALRKVKQNLQSKLPSLPSRQGRARAASVPSGVQAAPSAMSARQAKVGTHRAPSQPQSPAFSKVNEEVKKLFDGGLADGHGKIEGDFFVAYRAELKVLSSGAENTVYKLNYQDGAQEKTKIFKPTQADTLSLPAKLLKQTKPGVHKLAGIPIGTKEANFEGRSVASYKVDQLLFGDKGVCVATHYAGVTGKKDTLGQLQAGIVMDMAAGNSPKVTNKEGSQTTLSQVLAGQLAASAVAVRVASLDPAQPLTPEQKTQLLALVPGAREVQDVQKPDGSYERIFVMPKFENFNPANERTAEDLIKLQIEDFVCNQIDRKPSNYFVGTDGGVKAIDNDGSFGKHSPKSADGARGQKVGNPLVDLLTPNRGSMLRNLPPVVTKEVRDAVLKVGDGDLRAALQGHLTDPEEISAAVDRLRIVQSHLQSCKVVDKPSALLNPDNLLLFNSDNSYRSLVTDVLVGDGESRDMYRAMRA